MSTITKIQYADSTINPIVGCDGCPLLGRSCYAEQLVGRWAGKKGWPRKFTEPTYFPERMEEALRWKDLTGTKRTDKPWLDGSPRIIFVNDLGDSFTESAPKVGGRHWLCGWIHRMGASPHIWLLLTKRAKRMREFFDGGYVCPPNVYCGVSVIDNAMARKNLPELAATRCNVKWVSYEPALEDVDFSPWLTRRVAWANGGGPQECEHGFAAGVPCQQCNPSAFYMLVMGGESGRNARPFDVEWARRRIAECQAAGIGCFVKQAGSKPVWGKDDWPNNKLRDSHGGDWFEWPDDLRVRDAWPKMN